MRAYENVVFQNISASPAPFVLHGGRYGVQVSAVFGGGSAKLQRRSMDGVTYVSVSAATDFAAAGYAVIDLPPGTYQLTILTASAVNAEIARIPGD